MPKALSLDLRTRILHVYNSGKPIKEIAEQFYVSQDVVYKLVRKVKETGCINPRPLNNGRKPRLSPAQMESVREKVLAQPNITLKKLVADLELPIGTSALSKIIINKLNLKLQRRKSEVSYTSL